MRPCWLGRVVVVLVAVSVRGQQQQSKAAASISSSSSTSSSSSVVVFGTSNGFDAGGTDPMCWESIINTTASDSNTTNSSNSNSSVSGTNQIEELNQETYDQADPITLLSSCYNGTNMVVTPLDLDSGMLMYTESNYTFQVNFTLSLADIDERIPVELSSLRNTTSSSNGTATIPFHVRLLLCDSQKQGFCNPIRDTRTMDENLRPIQTDVGASSDAVFNDTTHKWHYEEGTTLIGLPQQDGDTFLSRWCQWFFRPSNSTVNASIVDNFKSSIEITFRLPEEARRGDYYVVAYAVFDFELGNDQVKRVDVANAIDNFVVSVQPAPTILLVDRSAKVWIGVTTALSGSLAIFCLVTLLLYRHHPVMRLAQGSFLAAIAGACLIEVTFTFTLLPVKDIYCRISCPLLQIPATFIGAVLVGRLWRIYVALSGANKFGKAKSKPRIGLERRLMWLLGFLAQVPLVCFGRQNRGVTIHGGIRQKVSEAETASLIGVLTLPQILFQLFIFTFFDLSLTMELNESESVGRVVCDTNLNWIFITGNAITAVTFILAALVAWLSRQLPSAFNEKDQIFNVAILCIVLLMLEIALNEATNQPTTPPDVQVFVRSAQCIGVCTSVLLMILWPKIGRVFSGEKVIISEVLGAKFSGSVTTTTSSSLSNDEPGNFGLSISDHRPVQQRIVLHRYDPLPRGIESQILEMQGTVGIVVDKVGNGRSLSLEEWDRLRSEVCSLKDDLDLIDLDWKDDESDDGVRGVVSTADIALSDRR